MNDQELDEMLNTWKAPDAPQSLRQRVRAGFDTQRPQRARPRFRFAFALAGTAAALLLAAQAFPQAMRIFSSEPIPYEVDSEFVVYRGDNPAHIYLTMTSYNRAGKEVVLTWTMPGNPIVGAVHRTLGSIGEFFAQISMSTEEAERAHSEASVVTGCRGHGCVGLASEPLGSASDLLTKGCAFGDVIGRETILGHSTVAVQRSRGGRRDTYWLAPDLGCFALRVATEYRMPADGEYRLTTERRAVRVLAGDR